MIVTIRNTNTDEMTRFEVDKEMSVIQILESIYMYLYSNVVKSRNFRDMTWDARHIAITRYQSIFSIPLSQETACGCRFPEIPEFQMDWDAE